MDQIKWRVARGCNNPFIQAAALSFATLSSFEYWSYQLRCNNDDQSRQQLAIILSHKIAALAPKPLKPVHLAALALVVINESVHPITCRPWSGRQRAAACGMAQKTWANNHYCKYVDNLLNQIDQAISAVEKAISYQVLELA